MNIAAKLNELGLSADNSVVIGSGILSALNVRAGNDIDVTVTPETYSRLAKIVRFTKGQTHGRDILTDELLEIGTSWGVLGKDQGFDDLVKSSVVINGVRYITPEFLLAVKQSWLKDDDVRQKDIDDVRLIQEYLKN